FFRAEQRRRQRLLGVLARPRIVRLTNLLAVLVLERVTVGDALHPARAAAPGAGDDLGHHAPPFVGDSCRSIQPSACFLARTRIPSLLEALIANGRGIGLCSRDGLPGRYTSMRALHRPSRSSAVNPNRQPL